MKRREVVLNIALAVFTLSALVVVIYVTSWAAGLMLEYLPLPLTIAIFALVVSIAVLDEMR